MDKNEFKCGLCEKTYKYSDEDADWSEKNAAEEYERDFGMELGEHQVIVCEHCYTKVKPSNNPRIYKTYLEEIL